MQDILLGGNSHTQVRLSGGMANRHGLIAGATGTGKTVSLQVLAEGFSRMGTPVFLADVKGDLSGLAMPGTLSPGIGKRLEVIGIEDHAPQGRPLLFWDLLGKRGHPLRTTISDMGPLLLSNLLELNDTQTGVLYATFAAADEAGLLLLDLKDLRAMLAWMGDNARELRERFGNISRASIGAIQRRLLVLEEQGAERFFGEPALALADLMQRDFSGNGVISVLDVGEVMHQAPRLYAAFLLWLLAELFENLPEVGDLDRPRLVIFFDEAHLLFHRASRPLLDKVEQVARLIRSKGVGLYFITQSPLDIPEAVLGQLGTRIQHALRAYTPRDRRVIRAVAGTFRPNPALDPEQVLGELGTGEALVSVLDGKGRPTPVERILMAPPASRMGPLSEGERQEVFSRSPLAGRYDQAVDRDSAFEMLARRAEEEARVERAEQAERTRQREEARPRERGPLESILLGSGRRQGVGEAMLKSIARSVGSSIGRQIVRGLLGSLLGRRR